MTVQVTCRLYCDTAAGQMFTRHIGIGKNLQRMEATDFCPASSRMAQQIHFAGRAAMNDKLPCPPSNAIGNFLNRRVWNGEENQLAIFCQLIGNLVGACLLTFGDQRV